MKWFISMMFLTGCVPPAENDLLADSDRFDPANEFGEGTTFDSGLSDAEDASYLITDYTNEPYVDQEPHLSLTVENHVLTVNHAFASINGVELENQLSVEVSTYDVVAHYQHIFTENEPLTTWHQITYTINCSSLESGEHTLYLKAERHDSAGTIESIEMDSASFIIE